MWILQETMRIYPAAGGASMRRSKTGKDVVLGDGKLVVPAGVALHMPITAVHHNEAIWENAKAFIPERFLEVSLFSQAYPKFSGFLSEASAKRCTPGKPLCCLRWS